MSTSEVERQIHRLMSEHLHERDGALLWLLDHAEASHPTLVEIAHSAEAGAAIYSAIHLLGRMGREEDVPLLAGLLERTNRALTWEAAQALGLHRAPVALQALLHSLRHDNVEVIAASAVALGERGDEAARAPLETLLDHRSETVRYRAVYALKRLGPGPSAGRLSALHASETSQYVRDLIVEVLRRKAGG